MVLSGLFNPSTALALLAGAVAVQAFTALPSPTWTLALGACGLLLCALRPPLRE